MKKIFIIAVLLYAGLAVPKQATAQENKLEITVAIADKAFGAVTDQTLTVSVQGDYPGYTYLLYDAEPWKGAKPVKIVKGSEESTQNFYNLKVGVYHVCVLDAKENLSCKKVEITGR
jgi:hypothetical protein